MEGEIVFEVIGGVDKKSRAALSHLHEEWKRALTESSKAQ